MTVASAEIFVNAPVKMAYRAFTSSTSMREWLCDVATVEARPNGRVYLWWAGDFYSSGHYIELDENKKVSFRWFSNMDPAPTEVTIAFAEKDGGTHVRLDHPVPDESAWAGKAESFRENWVESLENLKSILETGIDLRVAQRPMLGIIPGDFTSEQAKALGIPVREGLRLDGVMDGMGAQKCGLQKDDVIVEFGGRAIKNDVSSFANAISGKKGGDKVEVTYYHGPEKKTVAMELGKRPMPDVPFNAAELEKRARALYESALVDLEKAFDGFADEQAMARPAPGEWSALETVAHLISGERFNNIFLTGLIDGYEPVTDGFGSNVHAQVQATVKTHPSIDLMLGALRRAVDETLAYTALIPDEFVANKGSYYRYAVLLLQPDFHLTAHLEQIKAALAAARK
ncbi:MAG: SRPBCC domain-containing protein [Chloroflexi bacterium]|nr:SRPBCC domain-containing protein [Chloroflexota bacterium]